MHTDWQWWDLNINSTTLVVDPASSGTRPGRWDKHRTHWVSCVTPAHPALSEFPTEYYSDYQWWDAMSHSGAIEVAKIDKNLQPIVRVIDDWFTNRPLALLFEVKVGKGKLLVSGIDFWQDMDKRTEARQLLYSLKKYMCGDRFNPSSEVDAKDLSILSSIKNQK